MDEMQAQFGPPRSPTLTVKDNDGIWMDHQRQQKRDYEDAVGRLTVDNARKTDKIRERQQRILKGTKEKDFAEEVRP